MADDMKSCREIEEHLAPYVDGEAAPEARRAVEAHLASCPPCQGRVDAERAACDAVRAHRDGLRAAASPELRARCARLCESFGGQAAVDLQRPASRLLRKWAPLSLAATLVLAVAGVFLFGLNDRVEALAASLTLDHIKCFKVEGTSSSADAAAAARAWEQDQGWPIVVPASAPGEQLKLINVRRCFTTDGRSAHMMYTWRGKPVSLYVLQEPDGNAGHDQVVEKLGHDAAIWCANRRTYAVVAEGHPQDLSQVVEYMKAHAR